MGLSKRRWTSALGAQRKSWPLRAVIEQAEAIKLRRGLHCRHGAAPAGSYEGYRAAGGFSAGPRHPDARRAPRHSGPVCAGFSD